MKKMIIILGCVLLGCFIFTLILGDDTSSIKNVQKKVMEYELESYSQIP